MPRSIRNRDGGTAGRVNHAVWQRALTLAAGDGRRIEVLGAACVVVHNQQIREHFCEV